MESLSLEDLRALLALEQDKTEALEEEVKFLKEQIPQGAQEHDGLFAKLMDNSQETEEFFAENNERIIENLQMAVDSNASTKVRVELDLLHPESSKFVRLKESDVPPELWKEYEETDTARTNVILRLSSLRQQCEHIATICALFCHRAGTIQLRQRADRHNDPAAPSPPSRIYKRRYSEQA